MERHQLVSLLREAAHMLKMEGSALSRSVSMRCDDAANTLDSSCPQCGRGQDERENSMNGFSWVKA